MFARSFLRRQTMRAITLSGFGGNEVMELRDIPRPTLASATDVLIRVHAAGVNRGDISQRRGRYPPPEGGSDLLGLEAAGVVEAVGAGVTKHKVGDRVMALLTGGGYAEYAVADTSTVMRMPKGYSFTEAAAIPETFLTAWQVLKLQGNVQAGQNVLIHAGASGVGIATSQLTEKYFHATAITTSSEAKVQVCKNFASINVDRTMDEDGLCFSTKVKNLLGEEAIHVVVDPVFGGSYLSENASVLAPDGTIIVVAFMGGVRVDFNSLPLSRQRARLIFTKLRCRSTDYKTKLVSSFEEAIIPLLEDRVIVPVVNQTFSLEETAQAHAALESNVGWGKIILSMDGKR